MPCNCGKSKQRKYIVTTAAKVVTEVPTLTAAIALVREQGGHYDIVKR